MKNLFNIAAFTCGIAGILGATSCSGDDAVIPTNPKEPAAVNVTTEKIIYEANPRMYGEQGGLVALNGKLSEIKDYGTDIVWVMPINTPGEEKSIGSPYCIKDFNGVNPRLGTKADFKALVDNAHSLGMEVILDWVANHTAWDCPWVTEHPDWYVHDEEGNIVSPGDWADVAELNYDNKDMRAAMIAAMKSWVSETGINGFRLDNTEGVPDDFWKEAIETLRQSNPDLFILAETSYPNAYAYGANMIYGWHFATDLSGLFNGSASQGELVNAVKEEIEQTPDDNATRIMRYSVNHDIAAEKSIAQLFGTEEGAEAAYAIALFCGGTPMFYTSQLCNYTGTASFFTYESADFNSAKIAGVKKLNQIFKSTAEIRQGQLSTFQAGKCVLMEYQLGNSHLVIAANPNNREFEVKMPIEVAGLSVKELVSDMESVMPVAATLQPYEYRIYQR
ncbi:MAG: alpha-amylase [Bacteroides sp.]|nr:alpha-amylase [Bacteroides sp.]